MFKLISITIRLHFNTPRKLFTKYVFFFFFFRIKSCTNNFVYYLRLNCKAAYPLGTFLRKYQNNEKYIITIIFQQKPPSICKPGFRWYYRYYFDRHTVDDDVDRGFVDNTSIYAQTEDVVSVFWETDDENMIMFSLEF